MSQHVVSHLGQWAVKRSGAERATKVFNTQQKAVSAATQIAKNQHTELYIHRKDGTIAKKNSYGNDPMPPRDKK